MTNPWSHGPQAQTGRRERQEAMRERRRWWRRRLGAHEGCQRALAWRAKEVLVALPRCFLCTACPRAWSRPTLDDRCAPRLFGQSLARSRRSGCAVGEENSNGMPETANICEVPAGNKRQRARMQAPAVKLRQRWRARLRFVDRLFCEGCALVPGTRHRSRRYAASNLTCMSRARSRCWKIFQAEGLLHEQKPPQMHRHTDLQRHRHHSPTSTPTPSTHRSMGKRERHGRPSRKKRRCRIKRRRAKLEIRMSPLATSWPSLSHVRSSGPRTGDARDGVTMCLRSYKRRRKGDVVLPGPNQTSRSDAC